MTYSVGPTTWPRRQEGPQLRKRKRPLGSPDGRSRIQVPSRATKPTIFHTSRSQNVHLPPKDPLMERLIVIPLDGKPGRFSARVQSTGAPVITGSKQPFADGARELLARGFDSGMLLTMRHEGSVHDGFQALPIAKWAGWTLRGGRDEAPAARPLDAVSHGGGYPKVDLRPVECTQTHPRAKTTVRSDIPDGRLGHLRVKAGPRARFLASAKGRTFAVTVEQRIVGQRYNGKRHGC